jgi:tungstate transport system substrate-binding protein
VLLQRSAVLAVLSAVGAFVLVAACGGGAQPAQGQGQGQERSLILATTTSTQDSGLLDDLLPAFTAETGWDVKTVAVGSGQAMELGRRGEADVLLVHSPDAEEKLVAEGTTGRRLLVMHNDFVLVGPEADPAGVRGTDITEAMRRLSGSGAVFVSRGDDSGTHAKERSLWEDAGVSPGGPGYQETGQGMGATLRVAAEKAGYTLSDRATYLSQPDGLTVLAEGDPGLLNVYHVIEMTTRAGARVQEDGGAAFADWITSPATQQRIGDFGRDRYGQPLFFPDAGKPEPTGG